MATRRLQVAHKLVLFPVLSLLFLWPNLLAGGSGRCPGHGTEDPEYRVSYVCHQRLARQTFPDIDAVLYAALLSVHGELRCRHIDLRVWFLQVAGAENWAVLRKDSGDAPGQECWEPPAAGVCTHGSAHTAV